MRKSWPLVILSCALGVAAGLPVAAQSVTQSQNESGDRKILNVGDYSRWNRIGNTSLSADGKWMTYSYQSTPATSGGGAEAGGGPFHIRELDGNTLHVIPGGAAPTFSADSRWAGYFVTPTDSARGNRANAAAPAAPRAGGGGGGPASNRRFELIDLSTGEKTTIAGAASFSFSSDAQWVAVRMNRTSTDTTLAGADLLLRELETGSTRNIGNVAQFAFNESGHQLAYTVDAAGRLGNGVYIIELATGRTRTLASDSARFDQLAWNEAGSALLAYRGNKDRTERQRDNVLLAWTDVGTPRETLIEYDPALESGFPQGMVLSEFTAPQWSRDGSRIFIGLKEQQPEPESSSRPVANVDVFHWKDTELQSVQIVRLQQLRRATYPGVFIVDTRRVVKWGDELLDIVARTTDGRWAVGKVDTAYAHAVTWQFPYADFYRINGETGARTLIVHNLMRTLGVSDDGKWFLYLKDKRVHAYNFETGTSSVIDAGRSFLNTMDDFTYETGIWGVAGWSKDGRSVLLYDQFDIWQMPLQGGGRPVNLTAGAGAAQQIAFCLVRPGAGGGRAAGGGGTAGSRCRAVNDADNDGIDTSKPLMLSAYGEWTKKTGYFTVVPGQAPKPLIWVDRNISLTTKADSVDRILFTQQTFEEFPDYWVSDVAFSTQRKVTDANPFLSEYAWGRKILIDYRNSKGQRLQGTLTLPANYEPGKRYPMLIVFYQTMSDQQHVFSTPGYNHSPQPSTYASNGYLVFQPDIVYEIGHPGTSALDCMKAAVNKVIELGYADPKRIGMHGHSWSGYQSSFFITQTDMFAAVVTGAPPTNLMSFYNSLYKSTGATQQGITELSQVRMGKDVTPWNAHQLYESQSPIHNVTNIRTPFMILHGTEDGAVDYLEGLQFYNAARRNGKQVILLSYPGEGHSLTRRENQIDFQIRMKQFFDHYLKGEPAPKWLTDGVPQLEKGGPIR
jgi:dienelactone hydrolase